jgi:nickel/cobalt transporter (NiCoT) family protein
VGVDPGSDAAGTVTVLSVLAALVIGSIVLVQLLAEKLGSQSGALAWVAALDLEYVGFILVALIVLTWLIAVAVWRLGRIEQRWLHREEATAQP